MQPGALRRLAIAVFLLFGVLGPLTVLMESEFHLVSWGFIVTQTISSGGLAASIILFGRKKWWRTMLIAGFWTAAISLNSGGLSFVGDERGLHVVLGNFNPTAHKNLERSGPRLDPAELDAIYTQRSIVGALAIALLASGYGMFISVIGKELQQRTRLETEIRIAQGIQRSLLPKPSITLPWCVAASVTVPATEVGGDYFDIVQLSDTVLAVVIADVTGHGVGAGILAAMTKSAVHLQLEHDPAPAQMLEHLNRTIHRLSDEKTFVTCAYALLDSSTHRMHVATAGHPPILHYRATTKTVFTLRTPGLGLGIRADTKYTSLEIGWDPGDALLLYTDGILEVTGKNGEQFGTERLEKALSDYASSARDICSEILTALRTFSGLTDFYDDVSLVHLKLS